MTTRTLFELLNVAIQEDAGEDGQNEAFNNVLAEIQSVLGQTDGGAAGMFFDDNVIDTWNLGKPETRVRILSDYIAYELRGYLDF